MKEDQVQKMEIINDYLDNWNPMPKSTRQQGSWIERVDALVYCLTDRISLEEIVNLTGRLDEKMKKQGL